MQLSKGSLNFCAPIVLSDWFSFFWRTPGAKDFVMRGPEMTRTTADTTQTAANPSLDDLPCVRYGLAASPLMRSFGQGYAFKVQPWTPLAEPPHDAGRWFALQRQPEAVPLRIAHCSWRD